MIREEPHCGGGKEAELSASLLYGRLRGKTMGFRKFAKSQYDTIKMRDPALKEEREVFLYPYVKALYWYRIAHKLYKKTKRKVLISTIFKTFRFVFLFFIQ